MTLPRHDLLLAWYADDYTGAAAVLEVLAFAGVKAMLFLDLPSDEQLARFPDLQAIGIASTARTESPAWMDQNLPAVFTSLLSLKAKLFHYKICSTLDSSASIGSIGRVIEIAADLIKPDAVPVLVAAPQMRRYQIFGHLFAAFGDEIFRLDRHPVMARHPVTPMTESDVARHIASQSERIDTAVWSFEDIAGGRYPNPVMNPGRIPVLTIDCIDASGEAAAGQLLWRNAARNPFVVGSQGVEYALVRYWTDSDMLPERHPPGSAGQCDGMVTVSASVSPVTAQQIAWSRNNGFHVIRFDVLQICGNEAILEKEVARIISEGLSALAANRDPLVFTAEGPDDPAVAQLTQAVTAAGLDMAEVNQRIGTTLGRILYQLLLQGNVRRAVVSGGDTSGHVTRQLGIYAIEALAPTIPGASLSVVHADGPMNGLQLALKGGQMGSQDYFGWIRDGGGAR